MGKNYIILLYYIIVEGLLEKIILAKRRYILKGPLITVRKLYTNLYNILLYLRIRRIHYNTSMNSPSIRSIINEPLRFVYNSF